MNGLEKKKKYTLKARCRGRKINKLRIVKGAFGFFYFPEFDLPARPKLFRCFVTLNTLGKQKKEHGACVFWTKNVRNPVNVVLGHCF